MYVQFDANIAATNKVLKIKFTGQRGEFAFLYSSQDEMGAKIRKPVPGHVVFFVLKKLEPFSWQLSSSVFVPDTVRTVQRDSYNQGKE